MSKPCHRSAAILAVALGLLLPAAGAAQPQRGGGSVLWLPQPTGQLEPGPAVQGSLSSADYRLASDAYFDVWELRGQVGQSLTVDLRSDAFDAMLYVVGPGLEETLSDDDGGGGCHARITITFLEPGVYRVIATSSGFRETGVYTLRAAAQAEPPESRSCGAPELPPLPELPTENRQLRVGEQASGSIGSADRKLEDGTPAQAWALDGRAGQTVEITLESDDFDAFLYLVGPGVATPLSDDDSGGELNARITVTLTETATYVIVVSSVDRGATGAFRLSVRTP